MDLPTCPACGQSVLDDDVEDCPFCGASMTTGRPSRKPPGQSTAPAKTKAVGHAAAKGSSPSTAAAEKANSETGEAGSETGEEDPFDVDTLAIQTAIRAKPKPVKGRTHKVICPMCETAGFVPRKAAGRDVRCANPECLVPVFTAPEIKKKPVEPAEPEKKPGLPKGLVVALSIVLLAAGGGGVWYFVWGRLSSLPRPIGRLESLPHDGAQPPPNGNRSTDKDRNGNDSNQKHPTVGTEKNTDKGQVPSKDVPQRLSLAEIQQTALQQMIVASRQRDQNRSKPYCRRLTAEAFAQAGDLDEARSQVEQLRKVGRGVPFYRIAPLVTIAWKEFQAGRKDAAAKTVEEARTAAQELPEFGRDPLDAATMLATVLIALGRADAAEPLISRDRDSGPVSQLSATLQIVRALETYDFDAASSAPLLPWTAPQRVAVTLGLIGRGLRDEALRWAKRAPGIEERTDCVVAWGTAVATSASRNKQPGQMRLLQDAAKDLPPAGKARVFARAAGAQLAAGDKTAAEQTLKAARAALESAPPSQAFTVPGMKELCRLELPSAVLLRTAALAAAEIARVEAQRDQPQAAWDSLAVAMKFARAMAPAPPAIQQRLDEIDKLGSSAIRTELKRLLVLESNDAARIAARNYRKKCTKILKAAEARLKLQVSLLAGAVDWNIRDQIWNEIRSRSLETAVDKKEPFFETSLPWTLADRYREAGAEDKAKEIEAALSGSERGPDPWEQLKQTTAHLIAAGRVVDAATQIENSHIDKMQRFGWMLRLACRLVKAGSVESAFGFVTALGDPIWREEALALISAQAARNGDARVVWAFVENTQLPQTEKVSVYRGLIAGISLAAAPGAARVAPEQAMNLYCLAISR